MGVLSSLFYEMLCMGVGSVGELSPLWEVWRLWLEKWLSRNSGDPRLNVVRDAVGVGMAAAAVRGGRHFCLAVAICR